jgi:hypothetical protein
MMCLEAFNSRFQIIYGERNQWKVSRLRVLGRNGPPFEDDPMVLSYLPIA